MQSSNDFAPFSPFYKGATYGRSPHPNYYLNQNLLSPAELQMPPHSYCKRLCNFKDNPS